MNCNECRESFSEYSQQTLADNLSDSLQHHLTQCHDCKAVWQEFQQLGMLLDEPAPLSIASRQRIHRHILNTADHQRSSAKANASLAFLIFQKFWPSRPAWAAGYSFTLILTGVFGGQLLPASSTESLDNPTPTALICPVMSPSTQWLPDLETHSFT